MATDTPKNLRNMVIYEVYVRNHSAEGTFEAVTRDLPRISQMGVDVVWLMPIHPIGQLNKKGSLGCPYSIQDYRQVNPEYGSIEDFKQLCDTAHSLGLKVMIDVVYNHTSHDSVLVQEHPDWYHQDADGRPVTTVPDWSDVIDLAYDRDPALWDYQIESLKMWAMLGVDGFRCDVASIVPLDFWLRARAEVAKIKPGVIWLAESVHASFILHRRDHGLTAFSDSEIHQAFDLSYDYDIWEAWKRAIKDPTFLLVYIDILRLQKALYPAHAIKMRCVENHDQPRIMKFIPTRNQALAWTAFQAFNEGAFLIYAGQEAENTHTPSLFDIDKVDWASYSLQPFLTKLCQIKKRAEIEKGSFHILTANPAISAIWQAGQVGLFGIFNVAGAVGTVPAPLADGDYKDLISGEVVSISHGRMSIPTAAVILTYSGEIDREKYTQPSVIL